MYCKAEAIHKNKKYNGWSKTSVEGVAHCSWALKKITLLNEDMRRFEIKIKKLRESYKQILKRFIKTLIECKQLLQALKDEKELIEVV